MPQILHMVETDIGNNTQIGGDDIGTVQTSAHAYLYNGYIHFLIGKIAECHCRGKFEERRVQRFEKGTVVFYKVDHILFGNHFTVDTDTLAEINQMRGSE